MFKLGKINHIAIATPNLKKATQFYEKVLRAKVSKVQDLPEHGVQTVFVSGAGDTKIELLHPLGNASPIENFLKKNPNGGIHHICYEVDDLDEAVKHVQQCGIRVLGEVSLGAHGNPVVFLHPKDCGNVLVELEKVDQE